MSLKETIKKLQETRLKIRDKILGSSIVFACFVFLSAVAASSIAFFIMNKITLSTEADAFPIIVLMSIGGDHIGV